MFYIQRYLLILLIFFCLSQFNLCLRMYLVCLIQCTLFNYMFNKEKLLPQNILDNVVNPHFDVIKVQNVFTNVFTKYTMMWQN